MTEVLTIRTLEEIERNFKRNDRYITESGKSIFCPHVNGLVNIGLAELGHQDDARSNCKNFLQSSQFHNGLFYNETDSNGRVLDYNVNSCRNAIMALSLASVDLIDESCEVIEAMKNSSLYDADKGLFKRQYNFKTGELNPLIITQTNFWVTLALLKLGQKEEAQKVLKKLELEKFDESEGLFFSQDCRFQDSEKRFYSDDQALATLVYSGLNESAKANELIRTMIRSKLYDGILFNNSLYGDSLDTTKSSYKNGLCGIALGRLGFVNSKQRLDKSLVEKLYDFQEGLFNQTTNNLIKIPDNSSLALMTLKYDSLKHVVF